MDTKPLFVAAWFGAAMTTLVFGLVMLTYLTTARVVLPQNHHFKLYAALPQTASQTSDTIDKADARAKIINNFFKNYGSFLSDYGDVFIQVADKYRLDFRLLPAIAMQESNGGKKIIKNSQNPFGWGIYGRLVTRFNSWEEAIDRVGRSLREDYLNQGLKTPHQIMGKYTPPALAKGGIWAKGVTSFMEELR